MKDSDERREKRDTKWERDFLKRRTLTSLVPFFFSLFILLGCILCSSSSLCLLLRIVFHLLQEPERWKAQLLFSLSRLVVVIFNDPGLLRLYRSFFSFSLSLLHLCKS